MSLRDMFLEANPVDGEQMLEEARIKAAKGSALFDALETHMKKELLSTIRERVEGLDRYSVHNTGDWVAESDGWLYLVSEVLSLLTEIEGEMK